MNRATFEAGLLEEGYEISEGEIEPNRHSKAHTHDFDACALVLDGTLTLVFGSERCSYGPGDAYAVMAGTIHEEHTEADGVRYVAGRRAAA